MNNLVLDNARIACLADPGDYGLLEDGAIVVAGDSIQWVGTRSAVPQQYADMARYDCAGMLVTPGLVDCHTHLVYAGNRAVEFERRLQGVSYSEIAAGGGGIMATVNATRQASVEQLVSQSRSRLHALLDEGVTTVEIKSGYGLEKDSEIRMLQAATILCQEAQVNLQRSFLAAHALPPEYAGNKDGYIDLVCSELLPAAVAAGVVDAVDAFCEAIGFSVDQVARVFDAAALHGLPVKCHAEQLSNLGGAVMSASHGALSVDHIEYLAEEDVPAIASAGCVAVLLPGAYYILRETQLPPVSALRGHKVPMALATDANPGSSPIFSPLLIMNMGCTLFGMTPLEALAGFTVNAAQALGIASKAGSIAVGKRADLVLWDCEHPAELSYHVGLNPCNRVMQGGQWRRRRIAGDPGQLR